MWIYVLGPFLSLLPARWRKALPFSQAVSWRSAAILSGLAESVIALVALMYWYSYSVSMWVSRALDLALNGKTDPRISDHAVGFAALLVWSTHPLTWGIVFFGIEGMVRLCGAFTDTVLSVFPLYLVEKIYSKIFRSAEPEAPYDVKFSQSHVTSYVGALRDKVATAKLSQVPDELCVAKNDSEEFLEIRASRAKPDWTPPRVVRYEDRYYRLEESSRSSGPRSFVYKCGDWRLACPAAACSFIRPPRNPSKQIIEQRFLVRAVFFFAWLYPASSARRLSTTISPCLTAACRLPLRCDASVWPWLSIPFSPRHSRKSRRLRLPAASFLCLAPWFLETEQRWQCST
jgi:hypothetical protein